MAEVIAFSGVTKADGDPDRMLEVCKEKLSTVLIVGETKNGEFWFSGSTSDGPQILYMLEMAKARIIEFASQMKPAS